MRASDAHRKITVIDGAIGYTGGMNIGREHLSSGAGFSSPRRKTNRDTTQPTGPDEIFKIMGFWIQLGVSGRMDAVPFTRKAPAIWHRRQTGYRFVKPRQAAGPQCQ
jgi:Phosphatidylserine/phosphatidylglycerophosphate/cardiolipin synthases and related enzymes